jgi:phage gp29-like protein
MKFLPTIFRRPSPAPVSEAQLTLDHGPLRDVPVQAIAKRAPEGVAVTTPRIGDFTPVMWGGRRMTPDQVRWIIEGAVAGNIQEQWNLFDMMEDSWPRLQKNLAELRNAARRVTYTVKSYAERGEKPTASAADRADTVEAGLRNWRPRPGTLELSFEDTIFDVLDCVGKGLAVLETTWQRIPEGLLPRCAHLLHPSKYGWNAEGTELGLIYAGEGRDRTLWQPFPPGQFFVAAWRARSGVPGQTALLRCLAPYWCGITFGWEWLLNNAQIFGVPLRWATYDPNQPNILSTLSQMLANLGSAGWAAFPQGTTMEFKEAAANGENNPQVFIQRLADTYADQLILGQDASGAAQGDGLGAGSGSLHATVRADRLQDAAQFVADVLNYQLVPAILRWNYGDESEAPVIVPELAGEKDPKAKADRDQILAQIAPLPAKWFYERHAIPEPEEGEETVGGAQNTSPPGFPAGPSGNDMPAPGAPSDAGPSETAARPTLPELMKLLQARAATPTAGDYTMPEATRRRLRAAHATDLAPLRKAAAPLLAAIEDGKLEVVGELEAFIARLDELAPTMVGAGELADALEAALAEAAISGAAGAYSKLPEKTVTATQ